MSEKKTMMRRCYRCEGEMREDALRALEEMRSELVEYAALVRDSVPFSLGVPTYERWVGICEAALCATDPRESTMPDVVCTTCGGSTNPTPLSGRPPCRCRRCAADPRGEQECCVHEPELHINGVCRVALCECGAESPHPE